MFGAIQSSISGLLAAKSQFTSAATKITNANAAAFNAVSNGQSAAAVRHKAYSAPQVRNSNNNIPQSSNNITTNVSGQGQLPVTSQNLALYDPHSPLANQDGYLDTPGEQSLIVGIAEMTMASHAYKANAVTIRSLNETLTNFITEIK
jgi:flagellar basal body rod protein FlgC